MLLTPSPIPGVLAEALPGRFVVFEGPDGSGKSSQLERFAASCEAAGVEPLRVREPGGTSIGERVRRLLLEHGEEPIGPRCETLLYMASRAQLVEQVIRPALEAGRFVLGDRFIASTLAYQGAAGGVPAGEIEACARVATGGLEPDLTVVFDLSAEAAAARLSPLLDRMEAKGTAFHRRVREGYLRLAQASPTHYAVIDAAPPPDEVHRVVIETLTRRLGPEKDDRS